MLLVVIGGKVAEPSGFIYFYLFIHLRKDFFTCLFNYFSLVYRRDREGERERGRKEEK